MPVDEFASEPTVDLPADLWRQYKEARDNAEGWVKHAEFLRKQLETLLGTAHAGLVGGEKVVTFRPTATYAVKALLKAEPELTQHFTYDVTRTEFDLAAFIKQHDEIAESYRSRSFRMVIE